MLGLHVYHKVGTSICHRNHGYVPVHLGSFNRRPIVFVAGLSSLYILSDMNIQQGCHCGKSDEEGTPWINLPTEAFLMLNGNKTYPSLWAASFPNSIQKIFYISCENYDIQLPPLPPAMWFTAKTLANPSAEGWREIFASSELF